MRSKRAPCENNILQATHMPQKYSQDITRQLTVSEPSALVPWNTSVGQLLPAEHRRVRQGEPRLPDTLH